MTIDFTSLHGLTLTECTVNKFGDWSFEFEGEHSLSISTWWRILRAGKVIITGADHDQHYGLPEPIDAGLYTQRELEGQKIKGVTVDSSNSDLRIELEGERTLEVYTAFSGYENWELTGPEIGSIVGRSHDIVEF